MSESGKREFHPELLPRRGEWTAWGLALAASVGMWFLDRSGYVPAWAWIFWAFLLFSGLSISLGNWLDRNTVIWLETEGLRFENGLRRVRLDWDEVQRVAVLPARWGKSVQVIGDRSHFGFKTLGEVQFHGEVRGRTGFPDGQAILDVILRNAKLVLIEESNNAYYYARG
jgi:MFS family permease